jgi:hypothetical protein
MELLITTCLVILCYISLTRLISRNAKRNEVKNAFKDISESLDKIESQLLKVYCKHERTAATNSGGFVVVHCLTCGKELGKYDSYENAQKEMNNENSSNST